MQRQLNQDDYPSPPSRAAIHSDARTRVSSICKAGRRSAATVLFKKLNIETKVNIVGPLSVGCVDILVQPGTRPETPGRMDTFDPEVASRRGQSETGEEGRRVANYSSV